MDGGFSSHLEPSLLTPNAGEPDYCLIHKVIMEGGCVSKSAVGPASLSLPSQLSVDLRTLAPDSRDVSSY